MTTATKKIKLGADTYESILAMLNSSDEENHVVALSAIEAVDFKKNLAYILVCKKEANLAASAWKTHAPNTYKNMEGVSMSPEKPITYKAILQVLVKYKLPPIDMQFYMNRFKLYLEKNFKELGYSEDIEITIKIKIKDEPNKD